MSRQTFCVGYFIPHLRIVIRHSEPADFERSIRSLASSSSQVKTVVHPSESRSLKVVVQATFESDTSGQSITKLHYLTILPWNNLHEQQNLAGYARLIFVTKDSSNLDTIVSVLRKCCNIPSGEHIHDFIPNIIRGQHRCFKLLVTWGKTLNSLWITLPAGNKLFRIVRQDIQADPSFSCILGFLLRQL